MLKQNFSPFLQRNDWRDSTTPATPNLKPDLEFAGFCQQQPSNHLAEDMDKWKLNPESKIKDIIRKRAGQFVAGFLSLIAFLSPILMAGLPKLGVLRMKSQQVISSIYLLN